MSDYPKEIIEALHAVMDKVGYVQKGKTNSFHNYKYAGESDLLKALRPAMLEAGLLLIPSGQSITAIDEYGNTTVALDYTLAHKSGKVWPEKLRAYGTGNDRSSKGTVGDKGTYKAITGANKYLLFKLFQIETGDDPEAEHHDRAEATPAATDFPPPDDVPAYKIAATRLRKAINACGTPRALDTLMATEKDELAKIKEASPGAYSFLVDEANKLKREMQQKETV